MREFFRIATGGFNQTKTRLGIPGIPDRSDTDCLTTMVRGFVCNLALRGGHFELSRFREPHFNFYSFHLHTLFLPFLSVSLS